MAEKTSSSIALVVSRLILVVKSPDFSKGDHVYLTILHNASHRNGKKGVFVDGMFLQKTH